MNPLIAPLDRLPPRFVRPLLGLLLVMVSTCTQAQSPGDWNVRTRLTLDYGLSVRTADASPALVDGGTDPQTGLPAAVNGDDGDRNFDKGSPVNNRLSALGELDVGRGGYGVVVSGSAFYDFAYHGHNDNDSPATVNKTGAHDVFTDAAHRHDGRRARVLDAYLHGEWQPGGRPLSLRVGQQVVSWGESLFFLGISSAQNPSDGTKANVPGVEIKDLLLPTPQVSLRLGLTHDLGLLGYYKFTYEASELPPVGEFFSYTDIVGPGARFLYVAQNPLYGTFGPNPQLGGMTVIPGTQAVLTAPRGPDLEPGDGGQFGLGLSYQLTPKTSASLYYLRYAENLPNVQIEYGPGVLVPGVAPADQNPVQLAVYTGFLTGLLMQQGLDPETAAAVAAQQAPGALTGGIVTTALDPTAVVPVRYRVRYFGDVDLIGASFSTSLGPAQIAGEYSYRHDASTLVNPAAPAATRADISEALVSTLMVFNPRFGWDAATLAAEVGYVHLHHADAVGGNDDPVRSKDAYGYSALASVQYNAVLEGWDGTLRASFAGQLKGAPALTNAFGALVGDDDRRASLGFSMTWLQRLEVGLAYNWFLGSPDLEDRPLADRDYLAFTVGYGF